MSQPRWPIPVTGLGGAAAGTRVWKQRGQIYGTVVVKATLGLVPDTAMALSSPEPLDTDERSHPSGRALWAGGDMAPTLAHAELWVVGHAQGIATFERRALDIRVALARDGAFIYEKRLSLGTGGAYGSNVRLPLGALGPLSKHWSIRARRLGGLDAARLDGPCIELPERFDWEYFQTAPADQRLPALRGDEWLILDGIYLEHPALKTYLPRLSGVARLYGRDAALRLGQPLRIGLDSLHIDVDRRCCSLLWRGYFPISSHAALDTFHVVGGIEWPGHPLAWVNPFEARPAQEMPVTPPATLLDAKKTSVPNAPPAVPLPRPDEAVVKKDAPVPLPPDSEPPVDTMQLTDSDAQKLAKIAATPFEAKKGSSKAKPRDGTVQLTAIDAQKLAAIAATPFETKKAGSVPDVPKVAALQPAIAEKAEKALTPASAEIEETLDIPRTLNAKQVEAAVLPFVSPSPPAAPPPLAVPLPVAAPPPLAVPPPLIGTSADAALPAVAADPLPLAPPPWIGTPALEPEPTATPAAMLSPGTLGAFFLAAVERAAARRTA